MQSSQFYFNSRPKRVLILGFGKEGKSTLEFFKKHFPEVELGVADQRAVLDLEGVTLHLGKDYLKALADYDWIVKAPGVPWSAALEPFAERVTSATQLFFRGLDASNKVIAVTGSKGKSTTASLLAHVLNSAGKAVHLVGNIGNPALDFVDRKNEIFVIELSSFQLERLAFAPDIAVWTSLFPEHLDVHGSFEAYKAAKAHLVLGQRANQIFIYHEKYPELETLPTKARRIKVRGASSLPSALMGLHNQENVALVEAVAKELHIEESIVAEVVKTFKPLSHRLEFVGEFKGLRFYDDAIATNPEATLKALEVFGKEVGTLLLGGSEKKSSYGELVRKVQELEIPNVVLFPVMGAKIKEEFEALGGILPHFFEVNSMAEGVEVAYAKTPAKKVVLLSTACPSFSLWSGYEEKGRLFQEAVRAQGEV